MPASPRNITRCSSRAIGVALILVVLWPSTARAQMSRSPAAPDTVLFICEHGTVRSLLAKLLFEEYAKEVGLTMVAVSRGTAIDSAVAPWMTRSLASDGFLIGTWHPQRLAATDLAHARHVVSFDVPTAVSASTHAPREQWDGFPSVSANYAAGRNTIAVRVRHLVDSLQTARGTSRKP